MLAMPMDVLLSGMTPLSRTTRAPRRARKPLIGSTALLRAFATAITLSSLGGMTAFANENLYASNAPLQPAAVTTATAAPTASPTTAPTTVTTSRTTVRGTVTSTNTAAVTRTKQS